MSSQNLADAFEDACSRFSGDNFAALSRPDQVLVTIWGLEADVNNGGFDQYYFNDTGNQAWFAAEALRSIGAHRMAAIAEKANAVFGDAGPPTDRDERQAALLRIGESTEGVWEQLDQEFHAYPDDIAALLAVHFELSAGA